MRRVFALAFVLAFVVALLPTAPLFAQDDVFCGTLADEDCEVLQMAAAVDEEITSAAYSMDLYVELDGVPNAPFDMFAFNWLHDAVYSTDDGFSEEMKGLMEDAGESMGDPEMLSEIVTALVNEVDTYQTLTLLFPADVAEALSAEFGAPIPEEISIDYAIVDGIGYVDLDTVAMSFPEAEGLTGWVGTELAPILQEVLAQAADDPDFQAAMAPAMMGLAGQQMAEDEKELTQQFTDIEVVDEMATDGEDVAVFETTFDFVAFASNPAFMQMVGQQLQAMGEDAPSPAELAQFQFMMPMIAPMLFGGLDYNVMQYIGRDTGYTYLGELNFEWDLSTLGNLAAMAGQDLSDLPSYFGMNVSVETYDHNDVGEIAAPEDAVVVPAESILASMQ